MKADVLVVLTSLCNEMTASKRSGVSRPHKQFRLYRLHVSGSLEILPSVATVHSTKGRLKPEYFLGVFRCITRGKSIPLEEVPAQKGQKSICQLM